MEKAKSALHTETENNERRCADVVKVSSQKKARA